MTLRGEHVIEITVGEATPRTIGLSAGHVVGPISFGGAGSWSVRAPGVAPEHGYLYFDGTTLFLRSMPGVAPVLVEGDPIPPAWTAIRAPAQISIGRAEAMFSELEDALERTGDLFPAPDSHSGKASSLSLPPPRAASASVASRVASAPPAARSVVAPSAPPPGMLRAPSTAPRSRDPEVTRLESVDQIIKRAEVAKANAARAQAAAAIADPSSIPIAPRVPSFEELGPPSGAGAPEPRSSPSFGPPPAVSPSFGPPPLAPTESKASGSAGATAGGPAAEGPLAKWWRESSVPQKATVFLFPLLIASVYVIFFDEPAADEDEAPATSASVASSASASRPAASAALAVPSSTGSPLTLGGDEVPPPATSISARPSAKASGSPSAAPAASSAPPLPPGERTLERRAADAVATGDFSAAAKLYAELAQQHPDNEAFSEAARILTLKANGQLDAPDRP